MCLACQGLALSAGAEALALGLTGLIDGFILKISGAGWEALVEDRAALVLQ